MNEQQLQDLLSVYRYRQAMPALKRQPRAAVVHWALASAAAAVVLVGIVFWATSWRAGWRILRPGDTISIKTRIHRTAIGYVDIGAGSLVRLQPGNRLTLEHGTIHAKTVSPPGIFVVDTPRASAMDLGCEYVLTIAPQGGGLLHVDAGWVALNNWSQSLVPAGASATISESGRLSPPVFDDASAEFKAAIAIGNLSLALSLARKRDALTILNLFRNANEEERQQIFNRLNELVPAPAGVTAGSIEAWWPVVMKASGVTAIKKKYPRGGNAQDQKNFPGW